MLCYVAKDKGRNNSRVRGVRCTITKRNLQFCPIHLTPAISRNTGSTNECLFGRAWLHDPLYSLD